MLMFTYENIFNFRKIIVYNKNKTYSLTQLGEKVFSQSLQQRQIELVRIILSHEPFNIVMKDYIEQGTCPSSKRVQELIKDCDLYKVSKDKDTFKRRCSTVIRWINWILDRVDA